MGAVLRASTGAWRPKPTFTYRWRVDGYTVAGATQRTYTVRSQDAGSRITVVVRAVRHGYRATDRTSAALQVAVPAVTAPTPAPSPTFGPTPAPTATATPTPAPTPVAPVAIAGDGAYRVGVTIAPGTYVTTASTSSCYWERLSAFDGSPDSIIANDIGSGQRIVTVMASDYGVRFSRCGTWVREADAPAVTVVSTGQYLVGGQIPSGLYMADPAAPGCYWAVLSAFDGDSSSIIDNDYLDQAGPVYVQVDPGVRGFEASDCGTWTRISS